MVNDFYFFIGKDNLSNGFLIDSDIKKTKKNIIIFFYMLIVPVFLIFFKENEYKVLYFSFYEVVNDGYCSNLNVDSYIIKINNGRVLYREKNNNFIKESSCENTGYKFDMDLFLKGEKNNK